MLTAVNFECRIHFIVPESYFVRDANNKGASTSPKIAISMQEVALWPITDTSRGIFSLPPKAEPTHINLAALPCRRSASL